MKSLIRCLGVLGVLLTSSVWIFGQGIVSRQIVEQNVKGGVITLYALDPLAQSFCFRDAGDGRVFQQHEVRNRCSDLNYNSYSAEHFAVGIEGARMGAIVDLGTTEGLKKEYGYEETVGGGQGFASVHLEDGKVVILKDRRTQAMQELKEASHLFVKPTPTATAPVKVGHVYLARIIDDYDHSFQLLVKLVVIGYTPGESVTFRWQSL